MSDSQIPSPHEKLSLKFILDDIRNRQSKKPDESVSHEVETIHRISEAVTEIIVEDTKIETPLPPGKKYFRIGEASELLDVEPYVLRYWESEFKSVRPTKTSAGHRVYSRKDVETLIKIRELLHVERFSIKGAKIALAKQKAQRLVTQAGSLHHQAFLRHIATELRNLIQTCRQ